MKGVVTGKAASSSAENVGDVSCNFFFMEWIFRPRGLSMLFFNPGGIEASVKR